MVRPRRPPAAPPRVARRAAAGRHGRRAGRVRALPPPLAGHRPALDAARGARAAPGTSPARVAVGGGGAHAPRPRLPARAARRPLRERRGRVGRGVPRPGRALLPRGRSRARPPGRSARPGGRGARPDPHGARPQRTVLARPARRDGARRRGGATGPLGPRLGRRGDERRVAAAPGRAPLRRAEGAAAAAPLLPPPRRGDHRHPGPLVADRPPLRPCPGV